MLKTTGVHEVQNHAHTPSRINPEMLPMWIDFLNLLIINLIKLITRIRQPKIRNLQLDYQNINPIKIYQASIL